MKFSVALSCLAIGMVAACSSAPNVTPKTTSSLSGAFVVSSFPAAPVAVDAVDEGGKKVRSAVDVGGHFALSLDKGHTYRLSVVLPFGTEPLVFPRASRRLDTTVHISTGAASVALGAIRHFEAAPNGGFTVRTGLASTLGTALVCEGGLVKGAGAPCVDDDGKATCDEAEDKGADGECENGKDAKTGASCTDTPDPGDDASRDADPMQPMAVPEHDAPDDVAGCNEGGSDGEDPAD